MSDINEELKKLKFHIRLIGEALDPQNYPIPTLVIEMDWDENALDKAHDIFEKYAKMLEKGVEVNWTDFDMELRDEFKIGYQDVKMIILAFYRNHQWTEVCKLYAKFYDCAEFHEIFEDFD